MKNYDKKSKDKPTSTQNESNNRYYNAPVIPTINDSDTAAIPGIPLSQIPISICNEPWIGVPPAAMIVPPQLPEIQPVLISPIIPPGPSNAILPLGNPQGLGPSQSWGYNGITNTAPIDPNFIDPPQIQGVNNNSSATNLLIEQWRVPNQWMDPSLLLNPNLPDPYPNLLSQSIPNLNTMDEEPKVRRTDHENKSRGKSVNINDNNQEEPSQDTTQRATQEATQDCSPIDTKKSKNKNKSKNKSKNIAVKSKPKFRIINNKLANLKKNGNGDNSDSSSFNASVPSLTNNSNTNTTESSSDPNSGKESAKSNSPSGKEDQSNSSNEDNDGYDGKLEDCESTQSNYNDMDEEKVSDEESQADTRPRKRGKRSKPMQLKCPTCKKIFTRPSSFQTHQLSHSGEKPFPCPVAGCDKRFSVLSNQRRHLKVHKKRLERLKNEDVPFDHGTELLELYFSGAYPQIFDEEPILVQNRSNLVSTRQNSLPNNPLNNTFQNIPNDPIRIVAQGGYLANTPIPGNNMPFNMSNVEDQTTKTPSSPFQ